MKKGLHFSRLTALIAFALASIGASAASVNDGVLTLGPSDLPLEAKPSGSYTTIKLSGNFGTGFSPNWLGDNGTAADKASITTIDLSEAVFNDSESITWGFSNFLNLTSVVWPTGIQADGSGIRTIPGYAFKKCGKAGAFVLHIPGYVKLIKSQAIDEGSNDHLLKAVYFDEWDPEEDGVSNVNMHIQVQAFSNNYGMTDVYVQTQGVITAENNAFPHWTTYGHADPNRSIATLHFPANKAELYVNLNHTLDEATASNNKLFQEWLVEHYTKAGDVQNGFYEFVQNGDDNPDVEEVPWGENFLRTYSHPSLAHIVPPGVKAYIVTGFTTDAANKTVTLKLKRVNVIPKATGVIVFGGANGKSASGESTLRMTVVNYTGSPFDQYNNSGNKNYLTATANTNGPAPGTPTMLYPYEKDRLGIIHRDFIMLPFSKTESGAAYYKKHGNYGSSTSGLANGDWVGFFRAKKGFIDAGKAYLRLEPEVYSEVDGGEIIINVTDQLNSSSTGQNGEWYRLEFKDQNMNAFSETELQAAGYWYNKDQSQLTWESKWGTRDVASDFVCAKYNGELEDEEWMASLDGQTNGIATINNDKADNGDYYTLQGVKVAKPQKGVYIHNGKKVIVK